MLRTRTKVRILCLSCPLLLSCRRADFVQAFQRPQTQRESLGAASYADEAGDGPLLALLLDAEVGQRILACRRVLARSPKETLPGK